MKNLLTQKQMQSADLFTIESKEILAIDLMEEAALAFVNVFVDELPETSTPIAVLCGKGNNGGDGLAIARILNDRGYTGISVYLIAFTTKVNEAYEANLDRLKDLWIPIHKVGSNDRLSDLKEEIIIDAVLGSGLNASLDGPYRQLALDINALNRKVIAVDVPTGFPAEGLLVKEGVYLKADLTISFQRPRINFFFPESVEALRRFKVAPIGLDEEFIQHCDSPYKLAEASDIKQLIKPRLPFSHKGSYGHALIIAGQPQTMGAALLAAEACMRSGAGLTSLSIPEIGLTTLNTRLPEVMYLERSGLLPDELKKFSAIAIGPGLGTSESAKQILKQFLALKTALICDADALNILAKEPGLLNQLSPGSILTPHMKEFDLLFGPHDSWWVRLETAREKAKELACVIVLKNQYTFIVEPSGTVIVNPTGNPGMAQGGMGDVLTGIIVSFAAQGYSAQEAARIACYLHGKAGDEMAESMVSIPASELAKQISNTLKRLVV